MQLFGNRKLIIIVIRYHIGIRVEIVYAGVYLLNINKRLICG